MKKHLFCLPLLMLVLFACKNPAGPSSGSVTPSGGALKAKVQFDSDKISCYNSSTSQILTPGAEVKEQDTVTFGAKLSGDTVVDAWYRNEVKVQTGGTSYTIYGGSNSHVVDEGGQKLIKVRCTVKTPMKAKVQFDSDKISCYNSSTSQILTPGAEVKEQDTVTFGAKLSGDTVVDAWYRNEVKVQTGGTSYTIYGVSNSHVVDEGGQKFIKVRCTFK